MSKFFGANKYIPIFLATILVTIIISFIPINNNMMSLKLLGVLCFIELVVFLGFNKKLIGSLINFGTIFVLILFVFNFGQLMILTFFHGIYEHVRFLNLMSIEDALYGFRYINMAFCAICLGILVSNSIRVSEKRDTYKLNVKYNWLKIAKTVIVFTFPVKVLLDVQTIVLTMTKGGVVAREWVNTFPNVFLYYGKISLVGFALLLICLKKNVKRQTLVFILIEAYLMIAMLSGIRSENVSYVCVFALLYLMSHEKKISIKQMVTLSIVGILGLTFIVTVGGFRTASNKSIFVFFKMFFKYLTEKNVLLYLLDTCGDTGYTAICVLTKWLNNYSPSWGNAYYLGWTAIIPSLFGIAGKLTAESCFALKLQEHGALYEQYQNIGGSLIGEQFFNFGIWGGILASFIIGMMLGWISKKGYLAIKDENFVGMPLIIPTMFTSVYWIRNYFGGGIREVIWGAVFCWGIIKVHEKLSGRKGN